MEGAFSNGRCWLPPKFVGKASLGGRLAPLVSDGSCVFTHSIYGVECAREVWVHLVAEEGKQSEIGCRFPETRLPKESNVEE